MRRNKALPSVLQDVLHHERYPDTAHYHKMAEREDTMRHHLHV